MLFRQCERKNIRMDYEKSTLNEISDMRRGTAGWISPPPDHCCVYDPDFNTSVRQQYNYEVSVTQETFPCEQKLIFLLSGVLCKKYIQVRVIPRAFRI